MPLSHVCAGDHEVIRIQGREFVANLNRLTRTCAAYEHDWSAVYQQKIHKVSHSNGFLSMYEYRLEITKHSKFETIDIYKFCLLSNRVRVVLLLMVWRRYPQ